MTNHDSTALRLPFDVNIMRAEVAGLLKQASETLIMPRWRALDDADIATKTSETDLVTIADREAEIFLSPHLEALLAGSFALGEEACSEQGDILNRAEDEWVWTIDPVDGTKNFVKGTHQFCSMVSLVHYGTPVMAWIYRPTEKDCLIATANAGVVLMSDDNTETPLTRRTVSGDIVKMSGSLNAMGFDKSVRDDVREKLKQLPGRSYIGCAGVEASYIALGTADYIMHSKLTPWDNTPVDLICREAGSVAYLTPMKTRFSAGAKGILLVAPDDASWDALSAYIWDV
ncbi:MAG: inositol monophosphatase [Alphaproteobacteria bacterium]